MTSAQDNFKCEWGRKPCSSDPNKPGKTYCTYNKEDCPVTFLGVYNKATLPEEIKKDGGQYGGKKYEIYWTSADSLDTIGENVPILV